MHPFRDSSLPARDWSWPTSIRFGVGRARGLAAFVRELGSGNPLFVTDSGLAALPVVGEVLDDLRRAKLTFSTFTDIRPNPTGEAVRDGVAAFREGRHDAVIAFGGGSALDAGKAVALMVRQTRPIWDFEDVGDNWKLVDAADPIPVIALPTTAGTGSELGRSSIITDTDAGRKMIIFHPVMMPRIAVLDPALTLDLPPALTASTGMDALCHALETFITLNFHPMADGLALQALQMIGEALPKAFLNGRDVRARADMLVASGMACVALQKGLGGVHALSHALGAVYDAPHGLLNAILLPYVTDLNRSAAADRLTLVAQTLKLDRPTDAAVVDWLKGLQRQLLLPATLSPLGISMDKADEVIALALRDPCAAANPVRLDPPRLREILSAAVGSPPDKQ